MEVMIMTILYVTGLAKEGEIYKELKHENIQSDKIFSLVKVDAEKNVIKYIIGQYKIKKVEEGEAYVDAIPLTGTPCQKKTIFTFLKKGMLLGSSC